VLLYSFILINVSILCILVHALQIKRSTTYIRLCSPPRAEILTERGGIKLYHGQPLLYMAPILQWFPLGYMVILTMPKPLQLTWVRHASNVTSTKGKRKK
jgi:hypothetical protein